MKRLLTNKIFMSVVFTIFGFILMLGMLTLFMMWFKWVLTFM